MAKNDHYAVLVTITKYPGLSDLDGPEADGLAFAEWLTRVDGGDLPTGNITHIRSADFEPIGDVYDAKPRDMQLNKALDSLLREGTGRERRWKEKAGERLYLFFAGHGFTAGSSLSDPALFSAVAQHGDTAHIAGYRYAAKIANAGFFDEIMLFMDCCQDTLKSSQVLEPTWSPRIATARTRSSCCKQSGHREARRRLSEIWMATAKYAACSPSSCWTRCAPRFRTPKAGSTVTTSSSSSPKFGLSDSVMKRATIRPFAYRTVKTYAYSGGYLRPVARVRRLCVPDPIKSRDWP